MVTTRPFFKEFVVRCPKLPGEVNRKLLAHKIIGGYELGQAYPHLADCLLFCVTEMNSELSIGGFGRGFVVVLSEVIAYGENLRFLNVP